MKKKGLRHGDMLLIRIDKLPEGLTENETKILMTGSGGNDHTFSGGRFYPKQVDRFIFGYLVADEDCKLYHPDHGNKKGRGLKVAGIKGGVYELRKQFQFTHAGMQEVID